VAFHSTHVLLSFGLILVISVLAIWPSHRASLRGLISVLTAFGAGILGIITFAVVAHAVFGTWPANAPFLTARGLEDGPVAEMITEGCDAESFAICGADPFRNRDSQIFLWGKDGFYQSADVKTKLRLSAEDLSVFITAAKAHPTAQFTASIRNITEQISMFGLFEFMTAPRVFSESAPHYLSDGDLKAYGGSRAVTGLFPFEGLSIAIYVFVLLCLGVLFYMIGRCVLPEHGAVLIVLVLAALLGNAVISGVLSDPHHRYQARIIWLLPFIATMLTVQVAAAARRIQHH
jgi:hypothetical protein